MPWFFFPVAFLQIGLAGNSISSPEVSSFDDEGRVETHFDLLLRNITVASGTIYKTRAEAETAIQALTPCKQ
jgi:hypothetical protein